MSRNVILAAVDFSESATAVVEEAVALAQRRRPAELHVLHVDQLRPIDEEGREARRFELLEWLGARLPAEAADLDGVTVVAHEASGDPAHVVVQMASDLSADVVVLGTHGRKGLRRVMMGSVAAAVTRRAGCSVLVIRNKLHEQPQLDLEPPCGVCAEVRIQSQGAQIWCHDHTERHERRYAFYDRGVSRWVRDSFARAQPQLQASQVVDAIAR